jgi:lambda family phage minor tail protein L
MSRASSQKVNAELFSLEPTALLEFFVIYYDYVETPSDRLYIHGGTNGINGSIYWQGVEYLPFPIQSSGFESKGDGTLPRPKLAISNQDFFVSNLIRRYNNLVGAKVVRKRTFVKFLDNVNFSDSKNPYGSADATAGLEDQVFFILRRASENRSMVEFELASPLELDNVTFPKRSVMARYCGFHYRGNGCRYMGPPVADENDMRLRKALDFRNGLVRRFYTSAGATAPNASTFTSIVAAATYGGESISSSTTIQAGDNTATEFVGYFKVDTDQAGVYQFGVDPDDSGELWINGSLIAYDYGPGPQNGSAPKGTTGQIPLSAGYHRIFIRHYDQTGNQGLGLYYKVPSASAPSWAAIPSSRLYYDLAEEGALTSTQRFFTSSQLSSWVGLNNDALNDGLNRGKWQNGATYKVGEFVYIENYNIKVAKKDINANPNWSPLLKFFICAKTHVSTGAKHPSFNKEYWTCDQCSKTINGCKLRFGSEDYLPFGGFPGTEEYSISSQ